MIPTGMPSPSTDWSDVACIVVPYGGVHSFDDLYVDGSYGTNSPVPNNSGGTWMIVSAGNAYTNGVTHFSYGSPGTEHSSVDVLIVTIIGRVAASAYISWGEYNSYGIFALRARTTTPSRGTCLRLAVLTSAPTSAVSIIPTGVHYLSGHELRRRCWFSRPLWWHHQQLRPRYCQQFLRIVLHISPEIRIHYDVHSVKDDGSIFIWSRSS